MNNNNRGNNNRRRGRSNNNRQQGGGQQLNRIDSRARGNAPQMLEKYRKLAHDAHLNGDRVQEEYFLQFADHYFRVIADQRARQEEQRSPRQPGDRWQEGSESAYREEGEEGGEFAAEGDYQPYERQGYNRPDRDERTREERPREDRAQRQDRDDRPREDRPQRNDRDNRARDNRAQEQRSEEPAPASYDEAADDTPVAFEPPVNPFVPESRGPRGLRPRRNARPAVDEREDAEPRGLDPAMLPPAISTGSLRNEDGVEKAESASKPRTRRPRKPADDTGEALEVVG